MAKAKKVQTEADKTAAAAAKNAKWRQIASKRIGKAIKAIANIGTLSNARAYGFTESEVTALNKALTGAVKDVENRYSNALAGTSPAAAAAGFDFDAE